MTKIKGTIHFKKFSEAKQDFTFSSGINIVYGESGVGKTYLLDVAQSIDPPQQTNFEIDYQAGDLEYYRVFQNPDQQIIASTVSKELTFSGECKQLDPQELEKKVQWGLKHLPDNISLSANPGYLSGGEKELLNLVTAIDHGPDVLLIDDGFSFLSEKNKIESVDMLRDWVQISGSIVIWTTSLIEDLKYGDSRWKLSLESFVPYDPKEKNKYLPIQIPEGSLDLGIDQLTFHYENSSNIYSNLSMHIKNVRSLGILGDNGSGKTTFAGLCFEDLKPISGHIELSVNGNTAKKIGYMDQFPEHMILLKEVGEFFEELKEKHIFDKALDQTFKNRLARFGVQWDQIQNKRGTDLPWVVLRIFLVVLLCHCRFDILILDEPTFGLGWDQKVKLRSFLRECMSQMHFIVVSHDIKFVRSICDKIIDLDQLSLENNNIGTKEKTQSKRSHNK